MDASTQHRVFEIVRRELARIVREQGSERVADIGMATSLTADLGLDSISFIEVAVSLEKALAVDELPLNAWSDRESERDEPRFTVGSLVELCQRHLQPSSLMPSPRAVEAGTGGALLASAQPPH